MKHILCIIFVSSILAIGCHQDPLTPIPTPILMPLSVGNTYIYYSESTKIFDTITFTSEKSLLGHQIFLVNGMKTYGYCHGSDTLFSVSDSQFFMIMFTPPEIGQLIHEEHDTLIGKNEFGDPNGLLYHYNSKSLAAVLDTIITTPAGSFHCFGIKTLSDFIEYGSHDTTLTWYCSSVGFVKDTTHRESEVFGISDRSNVLFSYKLK